MTITAPLSMPLVQQFRFHLVWFGVPMLMQLEIGLALALCLVALLIAFPQITLLLPRLMSS